MPVNETLRIHVIEAKLTRDTDVVGQMDPFVTISIENLDKVWKSTIHDNGGKTPKWQDQSTDLMIVDLEHQIDIRVYEEDVTTDDFVGAHKAKVSEFNTEEADSWLPLTYDNGKKSAGQLHVRFEWLHPMENTEVLLVKVNSEESKVIEAPVQCDLKPEKAIFKSSDPYVNFVNSLPFNRTSAKIFLKTIEFAHIACGSEGYVTLEAMRSQFTTDAWKSINDENSELIKILSHEALKFPDSDHVSVDSLLCFGLLSCQGEPEEKAEVLFCNLQEGGLDSHKFISAADRDFEAFFEKLCRFATTFMFKIAHGRGIESKWTEEQIELLEKVIADDDECESLKGEYLDAIYGYESRLDFEVWSERTCDKAKWLLDDQSLRKKIFQKAGIDYNL